MKNRIAQGLAFLTGIIAGVYLYREGFYRGRIEQSQIIRAERRRARFEPVDVGPFDDLDKDVISRDYLSKQTKAAI